MSRQRGFTLLIYGIVALAILGAVAGIAWKVRQSGYEAARLECAEAAAKQRAIDEQRAAKAAKELEDAIAQRKIVYRTITREVDKLVVEYRDRPCLTDDGVRVANDAIRGATADPGKPRGTVSGLITVARRDSGDGAALDHGSGADVSGMLGEAPGAD